MVRLLIRIYEAVTPSAALEVQGTFKQLYTDLAAASPSAASLDLQKLLSEFEALANASTPAATPAATPAPSGVLAADLAAMQADLDQYQKDWANPKRELCASESEQVYHVVQVTNYRRPQIPPSGRRPRRSHLVLSEAIA